MVRGAFNIRRNETQAGSQNAKDTYFKPESGDNIAWLGTYVNPFMTAEGRDAKYDPRTGEITEEGATMGLLGFVQLWLANDGKTFPIQSLKEEIGEETDPASIILKERRDLIAKDMKGVPKKLQSAYRITVYVKDGDSYVEKVWQMTRPVAKQLSDLVQSTFDNHESIGTCLKISKEKAKSGFDEIKVSVMSKQRVKPEEFPDPELDVTDGIGGVDIPEILDILKTKGIDTTFIEERLNSVSEKAIDVENMKE